MFKPMKKIFAVNFQLFAFLSVFFWPVAVYCEGDAPVANIFISGNRVKESVILNKLAFKKGLPLTEEQIEESRLNLYSLGLFKSLKIEKRAEGDRLNVFIEAKDGWFVFPWVMFGSRGGVRYSSFMLVEQNIFKEAERIMFFGNYQENLSFNVLSLFFPEYSFTALHENRFNTEYRYSDGAYNTQTFSGDVFKFGPVSDCYEKKITGVRINAGKKISDKISAALLAAESDVEYSPVSGTAPSDRGRIRLAGVSLSYGDVENRAEMLSSFGRIFGLGMADMAENLKKNGRAKRETGLQCSIERAEPAIGSDFEFTKFTAGGNAAVVYGDKSRLAVLIRGGLGSGLPFSQLFSTGRREGMSGVYAREFRGDRIAVSSANYRYPILRNGLGNMSAGVFADYALCFNQANQWEKSGAGLNFTYQFWRFPIPIGVGYTYSFNDEDWLGSFSVGGAF